MARVPGHAFGLGESCRVFSNISKKTAPADIVQTMYHWHMQAATVFDYTIRLHKRAICSPKQASGKNRYLEREDNF